MKQKIFYNILDKKRLNFLILLKSFKKDFYLAGGTALALQFGHRDSVDFDFFTKKNINTVYLFKEIKKIFNNYKIVKIQEEKNTLSVIIEDDIKLSFFSYDYKLIKPTIKIQYFNLASINDIGCMKLSAIVSRAVNKDYIDLYYILQKINLNKLLQESKKKFSDIDIDLILKSLVFFRDIQKEPIKFKNDNKISLKEIEIYFKEKVKKYYENR